MFRRVLALVLTLLGLASPALGDMYVVAHTSAQVVPKLPGYLKAVTPNSAKVTNAELSTAIPAAVAAGADTLYYHTGSYVVLADSAGATSHVPQPANYTGDLVILGASDFSTVMTLTRLVGKTAYFAHLPTDLAWDIEYRWFTIKGAGTRTTLPNIDYRVFSSHWTTGTTAQDDLRYVRDLRITNVNRVLKDEQQDQATTLTGAEFIEFENVHTSDIRSNISQATLYQQNSQNGAGFSFVTLDGCVADFSATTSGFSVNWAVFAEVRAETMYIDNCTVIGPILNATSAESALIRFRAASGSKVGQGRVRNSHFTLQGATSAGKAQSVIIIGDFSSVTAARAADNIAIQGNSFTALSGLAPTFGVKIWNGAGWAVNTRIVANTFSGALTSGVILQQSAKDTQILNNRFYNTGAGIRVRIARNTMASGNTFNYVDTAFSYVADDSNSVNVFTGNVIENAAYVTRWTTAAGDSLSWERANIGRNITTSWARLSEAVDMELGTWQAINIVNTPALYNPTPSHGMGSYEDPTWWGRVWPARTNLPLFDR